MKRGPAPSIAITAALASALLVSCSKKGTTEPTNVLSNTGESWCPEGFEPGPSDTCFAIPDAPGKDTPILVYLHGMYQGHGTPAEWDAIRVASQRGFAVVLPRGRRGLCAWRADVKEHFCWPQDPEDLPTTKEVVAEWDRVLWQVEALLEGGTHKRYVLGHGNGGAFASFLATTGLFPGQAYAVVNGGVLAPPGKAKPVPVILLVAPNDPENGPKMKELHDGLAKASWPHALCPREPSPTITAADVEHAVRFFKREGEGTLKAQGGLYPCDVPAK